MDNFDWWKDRLGMNEEFYSTAKWKLCPQEPEKSRLLARKLNIPVPAAQVLINRGIDTVEAGKSFLDLRLFRLYSPFLMKDMDPAVGLIDEVLKGGKRIAIYGDYDVDGVTATALLYLILRKMGGDVFYYIPHRLREGYGLHFKALEYLKGQGVSLLLTVDCGINALEEAVYARQLGMELVITDHHQPGNVLPEASAVVNPLRVDCQYPDKNLSGVGIAFKLAQALMEHREQAGNPGGEGKSCFQAESFLDLVALGTVADLSPLLGENRILVVNGLKQLAENPRPGLAALYEAAGLQKSRLSADDVAFLIAPRLNAAGRMGSAEPAIRLLLAEDEEKARELAQILNEANNQRQLIEARVLAEACAMAERELAEKEQVFFLLLACPGWHQGVLGIVASRMVELYNLPVILISLENGSGKGSGRSWGDFNLVAALKQCSSLLVNYGGHASAAGLTVQEEFIPLLRERLNGIAQNYFAGRDASHVYYVDTLLEPGEISPDLMRTLEGLEPFGSGNPRPVFLGSKWCLESKREVGKEGRHLQLGLRKDHFYFSGISFNGKQRLSKTDLFREVQIIFSLGFDRWRGEDALQMEVLDCTYCDELSGRESLSLIDRRGLDHKNYYLKELLQKEQGVILFINTVKRKEQLGKIFSGWKNLFFSHQGSISEEEFPGEEDMAHLVLYDLPFRELMLKKLVKYLLKRRGGKKKALKIHLLYGVKDFQENMKLLLATIPSLGALEQIYFSLQEMARATGALLRQQVPAFLKARLPFSSTNHLLEKSMAILHDASYLTLDNNDKIVIRDIKPGDYCHLLKDIRNNILFQEEKKRWAEMLSWQRFFLEAPAERILESLEETGLFD